MLALKNAPLSRRQRRGLVGVEDAVAALALGHVEGAVGDAHDAGEIGLAPRHREADADRHGLADVAAPDLAVRAGTADFLGEEFGALARDAGHQRGKLLAAMARHEAT